MLTRFALRFALRAKRQASKDNRRPSVLALAPLIGLLSAASGNAADSASTTLSFCRPPFVHPRLVQDLLGRLTDDSDQVVAINLLDADASSRYRGAIQTRGVGKLAPRHAIVYTLVERTEDGKTSGEEMGYEDVGLTRSGVHVLLTWSSGAWTMVPFTLLFVTIEEDRGMPHVYLGDQRQVPIRLDRRRLLMRKLGEVILGDRWDGELRVDGNKVVVGRDRGPFSYYSKDIILDLRGLGDRPGLLQPCP
ncbi:MAG TPA: hypothetical protein VHB47_13570 [Thermoanaerobaculia bacterium]|jgi:hypothetical protein|nr:hypothetical protein [Thermoanaerobaculia bacterium]